MKLLLTRDEIESAYREGIRSASTWSDVQAARTWRIIHRRHPWKGFFLDLMTGMAWAVAPMVGGR